jgi:plasmid stabilization system protein ParE
MSSFIYDHFAEKEIDDTIAYYYAINRGLGHSLKKAIKKFEENITQFPAMSVESYGEIRRYLIDGFPYSVYYEVKPTCIQVLAFGHDRQRPLYWIRP